MARPCAARQRGWRIQLTTAKAAWVVRCLETGEGAVRARSRAIGAGDRGLEMEEATASNSNLAVEPWSRGGLEGQAAETGKTMEASASEGI